MMLRKLLIGQRKRREGIMNIWDVILAAVLLLVLLGAVRTMIRRKKSGNSCSCGCGCSSCRGCFSSKSRGKA